MGYKKKLFNFKLFKDNDFIEIGGGNGELSHFLIKSGFNLVLFVEPDTFKFDVAKSKLRNIDCLNNDISKINVQEINSKSSIVTVIMQDVIEHISEVSQKKFFLELQKKYKIINFLGRTPNLKSLFGLRNSFGDNTHIYRFTDKSLHDFLKNMGFENINIRHESYKITGIVSLIRYPLYFLTILNFSIMNLFVYGSWEGFLTPNIVFKSKRFNK